METENTQVNKNVFSVLSQNYIFNKLSLNWGKHPSSDAGSQTDTHMKRPRIKRVNVQ